MTRRLAILLLLLLALGGALPASAAEQPRVVEVEVGRSGFNGDPNLILTVEEGELVEFRFRYADGDLARDNPHVMMIEGLDLETGRIDQANAESVLRVRPEKTGTYILRCTVTCEGHEFLQTAKVRVVGAGGGAAGGEPLATTINMATVPPSRPGGEAEVRAMVATEAGAPLEGVMVEFSVRTTFITTGLMRLGEARTNGAGEAVLRFKPNRGGNQTVVARYAGSGRYLGSDKAFNLAVPEMELTYLREVKPLVPVLGFWLFWLILGGIWLTYLFIFLQLGLVTRDS